MVADIRMNNKLYFIAYEYTPHMCITIKGNAVISEDPTKVWQRTLDSIIEDSEGDTFAITNFHQIDSQIYKAARKHNPSNEEYVRLSKKDATKL